MMRTSLGDTYSINGLHQQKVLLYRYGQTSDGTSILYVTFLFQYVHTLSGKSMLNKQTSHFILHYNLAKQTALEKKDITRERGKRTQMCCAFPTSGCFNPFAWNKNLFSLYTMAALPAKKATSM